MNLVDGQPNKTRSTLHRLIVIVSDAISVQDLCDFLCSLQVFLCVFKRVALLFRHHLLLPNLCKQLLDGLVIGGTHSVHLLCPFQIVSHVAVEIGVVAEVIEPTMKVPGCHNLIIFLKEEVKNLCSCVEPLQVEKYLD